MARGIDLSEHNDIVDIAAAKQAGLEFVLHRLGFGDDIPSQDDAMFAHNVSECERLGIPWGAYIYSYADNGAHLQSEVAHAKRMLAGRKPLYPIYFDVEDNKTIGSLNPNTIHAYINAFCCEMEDAGYFAGFYTNKYWYDSKIADAEGLSKRFTYWYARPGVAKPDKPYVGIWQDQIGETGGNFPGVKGACDTNICTIDYPSIIKSKGLNGWTTEEKVEYVVRPNDTLWGISETYHTSVSKLLSLNPQITNKNFIKPGWKVRVR
jgi:GH25 family lysozyme M1 (1,4-beta-N-acetylmuramidase)